MNEQELMQKIHADWHGVMSAQCTTSSVPEAFLAALIGNETGVEIGAKRDPNLAKRFEPHVLLAFWEVLQGRKKTYRGLGRSSFVSYMLSGYSEDVDLPPGEILTHPMQSLDGLATSWGATQIMGWHVLEPIGAGKSVQSLKTQDGCIDFSIRLLTWFANQFQLDMTKDFTDLFDCWNSGDPVAGTVKTYDPNYTANGLRRMALYQGILAAADSVT